MCAKVGDLSCSPHHVVCNCDFTLLAESQSHGERHRHRSTIPRIALSSPNWPRNFVLRVGVEGHIHYPTSVGTSRSFPMWNNSTLRILFFVPSFATTDGRFYTMAKTFLFFPGREGARGVWGPCTKHCFYSGGSGQRCPALCDLTLACSRSASGHGREKTASWS